MILSDKNYREVMEFKKTLPIETPKATGDVRRILDSRRRKKQKLKQNTYGNKIQSR